MLRVTVESDRKDANGFGQESKENRLEDWTELELLYLKMNLGRI